MHCTWNSWIKLVMPCEGIKVMNPFSLGEFNAHVGNDTGVWKYVIGRHGDADVNDKGTLLLQLLLGVHHEHFLPTQRCAQVHLVHRFFGSPITHWFPHIFSWLVLDNVLVVCGKKCKKSCSFNFEKIGKFWVSTFLGWRHNWGRSGFLDDVIGAWNKK